MRAFLIFIIITLLLGWLFANPCHEDCFEINGDTIHDARCGFWDNHLKHI